MTPEQVLRHHVAWGWTDEDIWQDAYMKAWRSQWTLADRRRIEALLAELRRHVAQYNAARAKVEARGERPTDERLVSRV